MPTKFHMRLAGRGRGLLWRVAAAALALPLGLTVASTAPGQAATRPAASRPPVPVTAVPRAGLAPQRQRPARLPGGARQACATPTRPGQMACLALLPASQHGRARPDYPSTDIYGPADLQSAYNLASAAAGRGSGVTVAVVDAYNDPRAAADLAVYRHQWGLPACDQATGAGCVTVVNQHGAADRRPPADPSGGWELEESLDMDMVSAICPNCHILLVEANSASTTDLGAAEDTAVRLGAKFISDSWGGSPSAADNAYFDHPGVAITVAAGDYGYGTSYPASAQFVTSVGGTSLAPAPGTARGWKESAWNGTGSGCPTDPDASAKPAWQTMDDNAATGCLNRTDNDVSAVADPNTPVWLYDSYPYGGQAPDWEPVGGTSVASPIVAAVYALAGTPHPGTYPASYLYQAGHAADLYPVTSGFNAYCKPAYLCNAADDYPGTSYSGPAGWGTPDGTAAFTDTAAGDTITVTDPGTQDHQAGTTFKLPVSAADSAAGQKLAFSATGLPAGLTINPATGLITGRLPAAARTSKITITAADTTGATGSVSFDLVALPDLRAAYHKVTGPVTLHTYGPLGLTVTQCLDDAGNSAASGAKVELWKCDGQAAEQWTYLPDPAPDSDGTLVIHGQCATIVHRRLQLRPCDGAPSQGWSLQYGIGGLYNLASGLCMTGVRHNQVSVRTCGSSGQFFALPPGPVLSGVGGQCVTDPHNSSHAGVRLTATPCDGSPAQLWPTFSDWLRWNRVCMGTTASPYIKPGVQPGVPVLLIKCNLANQGIYWAPLPDGQILNDLNGLCLDNPGSAAAPDAKLVMEPCYGSAGEIWAEG